MYRALQTGANLIRSGTTSPEAVRAAMRAMLDDAPIVDGVDYADVVDAATLATIDPLIGEVRLLVAARVGRARLIDNVGATVR